jgi:hypothetical protein
MPLPERLRLNAWAGGPEGVSSELGGSATNWAVAGRLPRMDEFLAPPEPADETNWRDPGTGWGLVLVDDAQASVADKAAGADAPEPLRRLLAARGGSPVLRYVPGKLTSLRRYFPNQVPRQLDIAGSEFGIAEDRIPRYLLIYGSPASIPWDLQYILNSRFAVGRLDLTGPALTNYVDALLVGWQADPPDPFRVVVWTTDHSPKDMSATMKRVIAIPFVDAIRQDPEIGDARTTLLDKASGGATGAALGSALAYWRPGLVVSTSHGKAGGAPATTVDDIGFPVGEDLGLVTSAGLLAGWDPYGAIWYAHACCSAGSSASTVFDGLFEAASDVGKLLAAVAGLGSTVAPLPRALLGNTRPIRAFIGHVEPTFDWTISERASGQPLAAGIRTALHGGLYRRKGSLPIGLAFGSYFEPIGSLSTQHAALRRSFDLGGDVADQALAAQLGARDRMSTVILGDPTVALPIGPR